MARELPVSIGTVRPGEACRGIIHVVQKGDSLYRIGQMHHVSVSQLIFANPFVDVYNLQIGDELCVPAAMPTAPVGAGERGQFSGMWDWKDRDAQEEAKEDETGDI